jgi:hypothetical protein
VTAPWNPLSPASSPSRFSLSPDQITLSNQPSDTPCDAL